MIFRPYNLVNFTFISRHFSDLPSSIKLSYIKSTPKHYDPKKNPILIYHGLFGNKVNWKNLSKIIATKTGRVSFALDCRNHGESPHSEIFSFPAMVSDIIHFMDNMSIKKAIVLGHSLGGKAFAQFAFMYPQKVEKLILVDIGLKNLPSSSKVLETYPSALKKAIENITSDMTLSQAKAKVNSTLESTIPDSFVRGFFLMNIFKNKDGKYDWRFNLSSISRIFSEKWINEINFVQPFSGPTLLIYGGKSDYINEDQIEYMKKWLLNLKISCIPEGTHYLHIEHANEFIDATTSFINKEI